MLRAAHPPGSQFKGYEPYDVQDLQISARAVHYRRERWLTPEGTMVVAPLPDGIRGHFGPELRRFVLMQYHQGQVTVERLVTLLQAVGVSISKRQVMRLLIDQQDDFLFETKEVLRAGLQSAGWISVDDTGARHRGANAVCTQIGNDNFAWFGTTGSKSRLNFSACSARAIPTLWLTKSPWTTCASMVWLGRWSASWRPTNSGGSPMRRPGSTIWTRLV